MAPQRLASIDAYRGLVMLLMLSDVLALYDLPPLLPGNSLINFLASQQSHAEWRGCSLWDLIQPSFSFLVGVVLPFSLAHRSAAKQSERLQIAHAAGRAVVLTLLGVTLRLIDAPQSRWTFEDTLTQIGLGYFFLYVLARRSRRWQWSAFGLILVGYWLAFALYPLPGTGFDWSKTGVTENWAFNLHGFAAHWNKNTNLAWAIDRWFLNLFPRASAFADNPEGYATLSFIPTLATMLLGLLAGGVLHSGRSTAKRLEWLVVAALLALGAGLALDALGLCPIVKRIWTPSWTLFSGGCCLAALAAFHAGVDVWNKARFVTFLVVVGANSITAYLLDFCRQQAPKLIGQDSLLFGGPPERLLIGSSILFAEWLLLYALYRRRIFIKI